MIYINVYLTFSQILFNVHCAVCTLFGFRWYKLLFFIKINKSDIKQAIKQSLSNRRNKHTNIVAHFLDQIERKKCSLSTPFNPVREY